MSTIKERNKKFYTEQGIKALEARAKTLMKLANKNDFPVNALVLGFGNLNIRDIDECISRIKEISDLIGYHYDVKETITKDKKGESVKKVEVSE